MITILKQIAQQFRRKTIERCSEILKLSNNINYDNLTCHYKGKMYLKKSIKILIMHLLFSRKLGMIMLKKHNKIKMSQMSKNVHYKTFKCFTRDDMVLLYCLLIILQIYLRLNIKKLMEMESKYELLNKCFKDCQ